MPYTLRRVDGKWKVLNQDTGSVKGTFDSKVKAQRQLNLLRAVKHSDWHPTGAAARK